MVTESPKATGNDVPTSDPGLALAMRSLVESLGRDRSVQVTGRSWKQLNRYVNDAAEPPFSVVKALAAAAGRSIDRLIIGTDIDAKGLPSGEIGGFDGGDGAGFTLVPRYGVSASAGPGLVALAEEIMERLAFRTEWLREMGVTPDYAGLVTARGDSMTPVIPDGALLLVDLNPAQVIRSGCYYVLVLDGDVLVKLVNRRVDGTIELISVNPDYPKETISSQDLDKLTIPGRVVWIGHKL